MEQQVQELEQAISIAEAKARNEWEGIKQTAFLAALTLIQQGKPAPEMDSALHAAASSKLPISTRQEQEDQQYQHTTSKPSKQRTSKQHRKPKEVPKNTIEASLASDMDVPSDHDLHSDSHPQVAHSKRKTWGEPLTGDIPLKASVASPALGAATATTANPMDDQSDRRKGIQFAVDFRSTQQAMSGTQEAEAKKQRLLEAQKQRQRAVKMRRHNSQASANAGSQGSDPVLMDRHDAYASTSQQQQQQHAQQRYGGASSYTQIYAESANAGHVSYGDAPPEVHFEDEEEYGEEPTPVITYHAPHTPHKLTRQQAQAPAQVTTISRRDRSRGSSASATSGPSTMTTAKTTTTGRALRSNVTIISNAIKSPACLGGGSVNSTKRDTALEAVQTCTISSHIVIVLRDRNNLKFRGIYAVQDETTMTKIYGKGPRTVTDDLAAVYFKYDSGSKGWRKVQTKDFAVCDAVALQTSVWHKS
eukprot:m.358026 g.358026  ORF g.358026 m.358026 type:complete len:475 (+) comp18020_c0_seq1:208-1632(+)